MEEGVRGGGAQGIWIVDGVGVVEFLLREIMNDFMRGRLCCGKYNALR